MQQNQNNVKCNRITFGVSLPLTLAFITLFLLYILPGPVKNQEIILVDFTYYLDGGFPTCEFHVRETLEGCDDKYYAILLRVTEPQCQSYYGDSIQHKQVGTHVLSPCAPYEVEFFIGILFMIPITIFAILTIQGIYNGFIRKNRARVPEAEMEETGKR